MSIGEIIIWIFGIIGVIAVGFIAIVVISSWSEDLERKRKEKKKAKELLQEVELKNYILREIEQAKERGDLPKLFWEFADKEFLAMEYENSREHRQVQWENDKEKEKATKPPF
jgi:hypothetical protein